MLLKPGEPHTSSMAIGYFKLGCYEVPINLGIFDRQQTGIGRVSDKEEQEIVDFLRLSSLVV